jgi:tetratricopeptide (TPR) repeat protein
LQQHPQEDSIRVHIYARIAEEEVRFNRDDAIVYAANALRVASKINSPESLAKAFYMMGKVYSKTESQDSARYYFKESIRISQQYHFEKWEVRAYGDLGVMEYTGGNSRS